MGSYSFVEKGKSRKEKLIGFSLELVLSSNRHNLYIVNVGHKRFFAKILIFFSFLLSVLVPMKSSLEVL